MPASRKPVRTVLDEPWIMGVDGCRGGWLAIRLAPKSRKFAWSLKPTAAELLSAGDFAVAGIDIPIGLPEAGPRACDDLARRRLEPARGQSVFAAPVRAALGATSQDEATRITREIDGRGVSAQAFGIYPKIADVDAFIRSSPALRDRLFEVHPELSFAQWNGGEPLRYSKKIEEGRMARLRLVLDTYGMEAVNVLAEIRAKTLSKHRAEDDLYDAFAALWTAERIFQGKAEILPAEPLLDACGIPMRITV